MIQPPMLSNGQLRLISEGTIWDETISVVASVVVVGTATRVDVILVVSITTVS